MKKHFLLSPNMDILQRQELLVKLGEYLLEKTEEFNITIDDLEIESYGNEMSLITFPIENSLEGLIVAIENNNCTTLYPPTANNKGKNIVSEGIVEQGWHWVINPWVYTEQQDEEALVYMRQDVEYLLEVLPKAVLIFEDDGSMNYNPNSIIPEHPKLYMVQYEDENKWKEKFEK